MVPEGQRVIANESLAQADPTAPPQDTKKPICDAKLGPDESCDPVVAGLPNGPG